MLESLFNKVVGLSPATLFNRDFSCEIFQNGFFIKHLRWLLLSSLSPYLLFPSVISDQIEKIIINSISKKCALIETKGNGNCNENNIKI